MIGGRRWLRLVIIVIFALALWVLLPIEGERLGRKGIQFGLDLEGGVRLVYQADLTQIEAGTEDEVIDGVIGVIANRINPLGVTEPNIEKRGNDQIVVELPRLSVTDVQKERIGRTATGIEIPTIVSWILSRYMPSLSTVPVTLAIVPSV